jgi:rod shape-determining protein MreD
VTEHVGLSARLAAIGVVAVLVQMAAVSQISVLGVSADLAPLVVAFAGLLAGSVPGAAMGFGVGLLGDLALVQTLGVSSLLLVPVGYFAGRLREIRDVQHPLLPVAIGAAATLVFEAGFSVVQLMLGVDAPVSLLVVRDVLAVTLVNAVLAVPVHALMRRVLGSALPEELRRRRRRAYTTGGLSPLSTSSTK